MTPYLAGGARRRRGGRMIDRRERPSSIVRPEPNITDKKQKGGYAARGVIWTA